MAHGNGQPGSQGCVELAPLPNTVTIRDSKAPEGPRLILGTETARTVLTAVKHGNHRL
ncbi:DUF397 domain-containing protein [Actinomadura sp. GC306]|uniref:DUF397 domain-containing protein n=1 Tax=Actinomadura sp. GC306 TaxID=2530367 RepID=UPI0010513BAD|nr:DUF397 domain-containing protein [Actinomadura sp. GC306]TDC70085.1 DUF397 domain-containing protein [Actinomadura sp. GC306]